MAHRWLGKDVVVVAARSVVDEEQIFEGRILVTAPRFDIGLISFKDFFVPYNLKTGKRKKIASGIRHFDDGDR